MEGGGKHPPPSATTRQKSPVLIGLSIDNSSDSDSSDVDKMEISQNVGK